MLDNSDEDHRYISSKNDTSGTNGVRKTKRFELKKREEKKDIVYAESNGKGFEWKVG